jgi:hypothetical protein
MLIGSLEPQVRTMVPISGGGGFADMGVRTAQHGALEGFILRAMAPLFVGTLDQTSGKLVLETIVPDLNKAVTHKLADVQGFKPWDTMVVENLTNGARGCGYISPQGTVRASAQSDAGDKLRILFYAGPQLVGDTNCTVRAGVAPARTVDTFESPVTYQWHEDGTPNTFAVGDPLVALTDGYAERRGHPDFRRFVGLGQLVLDAADPAVYARHAQLEPLTYPGTGETTGTHIVVSSSIGDPAVPTNAGASFARAAGLIDYLHDDARYGSPPNQVLLDNHVMEAICSYGRFTTPSGGATCKDVENFSQGTDMWASEIPRLSPALHLGFMTADPVGGVSAAIFPFPQPDGQHAFDYPGSQIDEARSRAGCPAACGDGGPVADPCSCGTHVFDIGQFMFNLLGHYVASGGTALSDDLCQSRNDCPDIPAILAQRHGAAVDAE